MIYLAWPTIPLAEATIPRKPSPAEDVADRLHSAAIHLLRTVRAQDDATGLSPARLSVLSVLVFGGSRTLGQLAAAEHVTAPTMTRLVAALEAGGLLQRRDDARDRRVVWLRATRRGVKVLQEGRRRRVAALSRALAALSKREIACIGEAVALVNRVLSSRRAAPRPR
jgi:DNA-binding MarR family transcriptional regulator